MDHIDSAHPDFIKGFVEYCYNFGLNDKQAAELYNTTLKKEMCEKSAEFKEGLVEGFTKSAIMGKALKLPAPIWKGLGAAGLGAGAYTLAPEGMSPQQAAAAGVGVGAATGAGLLALRHPGMAMKFMKGMVPFGRKANKQVLHNNGVLTPAYGLKPLKPLNTLGKTITNPSTQKFMGRGIGYGAAMGAGGYAAAKNTERAGGPGVYKPWYLDDEFNSSEGGSTANPNDPFGYVPQDIRTGGVSGAGQNLNAEQAGPINSVKQMQKQLQVIEGSMEDLSKQLATADTSNPAAYARTKAMRDQYRALTREKIIVTKNIKNTLETIDSDMNQMRSSARETLAGAGSRGQRIGSSFERLRDSLEAERNGSFMAKILNRATGAEERLRRLERDYLRNQELMNNANSALEFQPNSLFNG